MTVVHPLRAPDDMAEHPLRSVRPDAPPGPSASSSSSCRAAPLLSSELELLNRRGLGRVAVRRRDVPEIFAALTNERHAPIPQRRLFAPSFHGAGTIAPSRGPGTCATLVTVVVLDSNGTGAVLAL